MENQHRHIAGYRDLSEKEVAQMNAVKSCGLSIQQMIENLESDDAVDKRWLAIARTQIQLGFMALIRSIAKPTTFV